MFKKRKDVRQKMIEAYASGYEKAEKYKDTEIEQLKTKYNNILKSKDKKFLEQEKRIDHLEEFLRRRSELLCKMNLVAKRMRKTSYAETMIKQSEHGEIEGINDELEFLEMKMNKDKRDVDARVLKLRIRGN